MRPKRKSLIGRNVVKTSSTSGDKMNKQQVGGTVKHVAVRRKASKKIKKKFNPGFRVAAAATSVTATTTTTTTKNDALITDKKAALEDCTAARAVAAEPIVGNIFNREKLKQILKCLADQQQSSSTKLRMAASKPRQQTALNVESGAGSSCSTLTAPEIFNHDRLIKIKAGLMKQTSIVCEKKDEKYDDSDDSDCCVIFAGPPTAQIASKKRISRAAVGGSLATKQASNETPSAATALSKSPKSIADIFVDKKLTKNHNGVHATTATARKSLANPVKGVEETKIISSVVIRRPASRRKSRNLPAVSSTVAKPIKKSVRGSPGTVKRKWNADQEEPQTKKVGSNEHREKAMSLKERMVERLSAARFRYINEMLYTSSGADALQLFKDDPEAYNVYHLGYQSQMSKWPVNPLDVIVKDIKNMPKSKVIADFGCGDARLSQSVANKVHSFDLVALNEGVVACSMDQVPLKDATVDLVVFCLSLMGTNLPDYVAEANRVLKLKGLLKVAEVQSRIKNVQKFQEQLEKFGFKFLKKNASNKMFVLMDFIKIRGCDKLVKTLPQINLKPCMYKKR